MLYWDEFSNVLNFYSMLELLMALIFFVICRLGLIDNILSYFI